MTAQELRRQRSQRFHDAIDFRKPDRTPNLGCVVAWKILDAGYRFQDAFFDYSIMEQSVRKFVETYPVDAISDPGAGSAYKMMKAFGAEGFFRCEDHCINVHRFSLAGPEDWDRYLEDKAVYAWEKVLPEKIENWNTKTVEDFQRAYDAMQENKRYAQRITYVLQEEYGMPMLSSSRWGVPIPFVESLVHPLRNIGNLSMDIRRCPEKVEETIARADAVSLPPIIHKLKNGPAGHDYDHCFDIRTVIRSSCMLSTQQFERFYWKSMKPVFDACAESGKHMLVMVEGPGEHIYEFFQDYPKGVFALLIEHGDLQEARRKLPNVALAGGMSLEELGYGTPESCVATAKHLVDTLGQDGGYIFCESNFMCYPNDAKPENLKAVCDFLAEYRG